MPGMNLGDRHHAGFERVDVVPLTLGIATLYVATRGA
jgi:hypothetical protein